MDTGTDWITNAATEIAISQDAEQFIGYFYAIISKHCPFDYDTAYEPVNLSKEIAIKRLKFTLLKFIEESKAASSAGMMIDIRDVFDAAREVVRYD